MNVRQISFERGAHPVQEGFPFMVKRLLHKYHYPPEGMADAMKTVLQQCEMWTDNVEDN